MGYEYIIYEKEEGVATITLNRPERLNALGVQNVDELTAVIEEIATDDEVKAVILTGNGRGFCTGADLAGPGSPLLKKERHIRVKPLAGYGKLFLCIKNLEKPVIAAVNGIAAGAGFSLAMICDIRIASENAGFSSIFVKIGAAPDTCLCYTLPRVVGKAKALEMMFTGDTVEAKEAKELGIVSKVVPVDQLLAEAKELAGRIAKGPSLAIDITKKLVNAAEEINNFDAIFAYEAWAFEVLIKSEDLIEGTTAFLQKREAKFKGM